MNLNELLLYLKMKKYISSTNLSLLFLLAIIIIIGSCKKDDTQQNGIIPNVYVNEVIYPNSINYIPPGGWIYVNAGYRGIIVYRFDQFTFVAYERTCPYDAQEDCAVVDVESTNLTAIDSCCMSRYTLIDGFPAGGPSTLPLKKYQTQFENEALHIINYP